MSAKTLPFLHALLLFLFNNPTLAHHPDPSINCDTHPIWRTHHCTLGLWHGTGQSCPNPRDRPLADSDHWLGNPLQYNLDTRSNPTTADPHIDWTPPSRQKRPPASCINTDDLFPGLSEAIGTIRVMGDCLCDFYDENNCQKGLFAAMNREDKNLDERGQEKKINSFKCWYWPGASTKLKLIGVATRPGEDREEVCFDSGDIYPMGDAREAIGRCWDVGGMGMGVGPEKERPNGLVGGVEVTRGRCEFFAEERCAGEMLFDLVGNRDEKDWTAKREGKEEVRKVMSYRCFPLRPFDRNLIKMKGDWAPGLKPVKTRTARRDLTM